MAMTEEEKQQAREFLRNSRASKVTTSLENDISTSWDAFDKASAEAVARKRLVQQTSQPKEEGFLEKVGNSVDKVMGPASNLLFGTLGKTTGSLLTGSLASGAELAGKKTILGADVKKLQEQSDANITPSNIAFQSLELYPGGGYVSKYLKKLPGGSVIADYISKLPVALKENAIKQYESIFNATSKQSKALVKETAPELLDRGIKMTSPEGLATKAEAQVTEYGGKIDKFFQDLPANAKEETKPILDKLQAFKDKFIVDGKVIRQEAVTAANNTMEKIAQFGKDVSSRSARKVRQIFDEHFDISKGIEDIATYTKKAERAAADAIRAEFAKTRPDLDILNKEFSFWKNVQDLATYSAEKGKSKFTKGVSSVIGGAIGFSSGEGISGKASGTVIGAYLGAKAIDFMRSPAWKSFSAVEKNKLADAIVRGDTKNIALIIAKMTEGIKNQVSQ